MTHHSHVRKIVNPCQRNVVAHLMPQTVHTSKVPIPSSCVPRFPFFRFFRGSTKCFVTTSRRGERRVENAREWILMALSFKCADFANPQPWQKRASTFAGSGDGGDLGPPRSPATNSSEAECPTWIGSNAFGSTVLPAYCDTVGTREKCHNKQMSQ